MRFPLNELPFALPLRLTPTQCEDFEHLADVLVAKAVTEYEISNQTSVNAEQWKAVKTRGRVTAYKRRVGEKARGSMQSLLKCKVLGTVQGTLDDVMYGAMSPDATSFKIKSSYVQDGLADGRVLHQFKPATEQDPFRFVGLKWIVKGVPGSLRRVVKPRDAVILDSMGVHILANGERVGYHLMHSIDLPQQCPELQHLGLIRFKLSSCYIFRQIRKQTVGLYTKASIDPCGNVPEALAINSAVNGLLSCSKVVWCAENKKLAWLANEAARQRRQSNAPQESTATDKRSCAVCTKSLSVAGIKMACGLCSRVVCTKCRTTRRLLQASSSFVEGVQCAAVFCVECIQRCRRVSSAEIARFEHVPGAFARKQLLRQHS